MKPKSSIFLIAVFGVCFLGSIANAFFIATTSSSSSSSRLILGLVDEASESSNERRKFLLNSCGVLGLITSSPQAADARYVLDDETGDYVEVQDDDWQTAWKQRLEKAQSMSTDEVFQAARGAGNLDLKEGPESDASKKRRAMSACRDPGIRDKAQAGSERDCTARVFSGEVDFLLNAM